MPTLEYYQDEGEQHRWRLQADNGEILAGGEAHTRHADAVRAAGTVMAAFVDVAMQGDDIGVEITPSTVENHQASVEVWEVSVHGPAADYSFGVYPREEDATATKSRLEELLAVILGRDEGNRT